MIPATLTMLLEQLSPMVIVTGSFMDGTAHEGSDIDLYVKPLPDDHPLRDYGEDTYTLIIIDMLKRWGYEVRSCYPLTFAIDAFGFMLDFSALFEIGEPKEVQLFGAKMLGAKSTYGV